MRIRQPTRGRRRVAALLALGLAGAAALAPAARADVLVVGDSLAVGTEPALRAALADTRIDADSVGGRPSPAGIPVLASLLGPEHDTVVFDLGTNDGNAAVATTAASLATARELTGDRCLVVATLNRPPLADIPIEGQNAMIRRFAASTPNVALVDWNDAAEATPGALRDDGVHASSGGYALRGALFADAVRGACLGGGAAGTRGGGGAPPIGGRAASSTDRPVTRGPRGQRRPPRPPLPDRLAASATDGLAGDGGPLDLAGRAAAIVGAATTTLGEVLTPRGPEPVLGAE